MKGCVGEMNQGPINDQAQPGAQVASTRPSFLRLVTSHDLKDLGNALARGDLPPDFEAKLRRLAGDSLLHRFVEQNCRLFVALLSAIQDGSFCKACQADRDELRHVVVLCCGFVRLFRQAFEAHQAPRPLPLSKIRVHGLFPGGIGTARRTQLNPYKDVRSSRKVGRGLETGRGR